MKLIDYYIPPRKLPDILFYENENWAYAAVCKTPEEIAQELKITVKDVHQFESELFDIEGSYRQGSVFFIRRPEFDWGGPDFDDNDNDDEKDRKATVLVAPIPQPTDKTWKSKNARRRKQLFERSLKELEQTYD